MSTTASIVDGGPDTEDPMKDRLLVNIAQHEFVLHACGGLHWPAEKTLLIADTHFGKEQTFRRAAIAVPRGATSGTLRTLENLIEQTDPQRIVFLGDLFHAKNSLSSEVCDALQSFFERFPDRRFELVRGNHDAATGPLPSHWNLIDVGPRTRIADVALEHFPADPPEGCELLVCGHLHPAVRVQFGRENLGKMSCFWLAGQTLVLPAIGEFTGTATIRPRRDDRVWITGQGGVTEHFHSRRSASKQRHRV